MNEITSFNKLAVELDNGWWLTELQMDNCDLLWSLFFVSWVPLAVLVTPSTEEGWRGHNVLFSWLQWKMVQLSHHGIISVSTLRWIIASFLLDLCYVWVWRWGCEAEQKLRVIFVFSFLETVLQLLWACLLLPSVSGLVRCWPHGICYWTLCGKTQAKQSPLQLDDNAVLEFHLQGGIWMTKHWSTGDAVHSPSQLSLCINI